MTTACPDQVRADVDAVHGTSERTGFSLTHTGDDRALTLAVIQANGDQIDAPLPRLSQRRRALAQLRLLLGFTRRAVRAAPLAWRVWRRGDTALKGPLKRVLGLEVSSTTHVLAADMFQDQALQPLPSQTISIILPVHNALDLLPEVLDRVMRHTDLPFRLIIVEDASPDPGVRPFLQDFASRHPEKVELIENAQNLGFIGSVNRAFERAQAHGDHVLLLNSDAFVPESWANRLFRPIFEDARVATVTPMSNDAELFSVPFPCTRRDLEPGQGDRIDAVARTFSSALPLVVAPTGVGFCMAINAAFLGKIPKLDEVFGRGYGEEVDWCQKARALGGRHLGLPNLFVEHRGGVSFGSAEKQRLIRTNNQVISKRYPHYDREVQAFVRQDPLFSPRIALAMAWLGSASTDRVPIYLAHAMGGGAEIYLQRRIAQDLGRMPGVVVLRVGASARWQVELRTEGATATIQSDETGYVLKLLEALPCRQIVYSCGVGDPDPVTLPDLLLDMKRGDDRLEVLMHDFLPISPSYTLLDHDNTYRGPVTPGRDDKAHQTVRPDGSQVSLSEWQDAWGRLIRAADEVVTFCRDSAMQVTAVWPDVQTTLRPHDLPSEKVTIGVLGNIGLHKGAAVVAGLADALIKVADARLVVVGNIDPAFRLPATSLVHGTYDSSQLTQLVSRYGITHWLIPSIWPETFSYTTHEALATGLPVHAFALGGQGEAVAAAPNGHLVPFDPDGDLVRAVQRNIFGQESVHAERRTFYDQNQEDVKHSAVFRG
ncbi:glycosyltransferase [Aliiroseovarius subalbicans]|uniref:glycosyltransferase n=1 Tax=Aliiroseovarius subalbicans TaxID=2925840 RepID=UPI001F580308|nr:glycosyltransferase [Aliiroseovarius subalbicans]MCI2400249.1 glycosyltransferase [Aliiroseovarius subalbicans]